ncbi:MAG: glycosyltransferase family 2 protein [bacterium]
MTDINVSRATDLENPKERAIYRFFEMLPGLLSWGALLSAIILSFFKPTFVAIFVIFMAALLLSRLVYFAFHLRDSYRKMRVSEKTNWLKELEKLPSDCYSIPIKNWKEVYHLVILPMYREPVEVIRDAFAGLVASDYPKERMIVVLACEERAKDEAKKVAETISTEFKDKFFRFSVIWHPADLPDEIAGKSSNETWATKQVREKVIDPLGIPYENIIISSFDADTVVFPKYFSCLAWNYLTAPKPIQTSFQPIPLFINNIWKAPAISRVISFNSTFWHTLNQERPDKLITFSSHAMSFRALVDVGFKDPRWVSDDSHIFWQCFFHYNGDYRVQPLFYPVSMDANVAKSFWRTIVNIYKQQRRWAYGVGEIPYFLFGFLKNKQISWKKKFPLGLEVIFGHWSWATISLLVLFLGWLPLVLGGPAFSRTMLSYNLPRAVSRIFMVANLSLVGLAWLTILFLPPKPIEYGKSKYVFLILQWVLVPPTMIFFSAFPALDAQTRWLRGRYMGFWFTEKSRK